jgi:preprotein translocase subunit SecA
VTIATNMAGRGVDIKLGGELAEEILASVNRVIHRVKNIDPYEMTLEERRQIILVMEPQDFGIYEAEVKFFLQHIEDMERVRTLGGLHVIGSERHEARRIDNQLRGRSARQGDPGSSRFYLSMEDELMRLFGGSQADNLMQRLKVDDAFPLEVGLVGRIVEQSQTRVEGANFDVRKHLLEYDDVLNTQRGKIYAQRNLIFTKEDLSEDVTDMLRAEITRRIPEALKDPDGPWKLLAWLDEVQPPITVSGVVFPTYTLNLLMEYLHAQSTVQGQQQWISRAEAKQALEAIVAESLKAEETHLISTVNNLLNQTQDRLESQLDERMESVDIFFEGLSLEDETDTRRPIDLLNDLTTIVRLPIKLNVDQQRLLKNDPGEVKAIVREQVNILVTSQAIFRLLGSIERRLEESLELNPASLVTVEWNSLADQVIGAIEAIFDRRRERFLGNSGQVTQEIQSYLEKASDLVSDQFLYQVLLKLPQGERISFDKKTHRRVSQRTVRLTYVFFAAHLLEKRDSDEIAADVLEHLENAQEVIRRAWGRFEFNRLAGVPLSALDERARLGLQAALGDDYLSQFGERPIAETPEDTQESFVSELGRQVITEIYRQLILGVVSELWVDYLTQMEALRVSIGLEAYAQRDPLIQYKSRAFELFQTLLSNMRLGVINRMFTYRPRESGFVQTSSGRAETEQIAATLSSGGNGQGAGLDSEGSAGIEDETGEGIETDEERPESQAVQPQGERMSRSKRRRRRR